MHHAFPILRILTVFIPVAACCLFLMVDAARAEGNITDVLVTPGAKSVVVKSDAPLGRYRDFVIGGPNRLVIDVEESGLGKVPRRIPVDSGNVREIRLGYQGSNARLVVDFGEAPVPKYDIRNEGFTFKVILDAKGLPSSTPAGKAQVNRPPVKGPAAPDFQGAATVGRSTRTRSANSGPAVSSVRVSGETVTLDLVNEKSRGKAMKVNLEMDMEGARVRRAYVVEPGDGSKSSEKIDKVSAATGAVTSVEARRSGPKGPTRGPRKEAESKDRADEAQKKFRWGMPEVKAMEPSKPGAAVADPVRLDKVALQPTVAAAEGKGDPASSGKDTTSRKERSLR